jgi:uncharacterized protein YbcV (DUF1398 family)
MFTLEQIHKAHESVKSGADFPRYIQEIKKLGVTGFDTWVRDSSSDYFGEKGFKISSQAMYEPLHIELGANAKGFENSLKVHQQGKTDYYTFCKDCATNGVEKWTVDINALTCIYYDRQGKELLKESIPDFKS